MPSLMKPVKEFSDNGYGIVGYNYKGDIVSHGFKKVDIYFPVAYAIENVGNPDEFSKRILLAMEGNTSVIGYMHSLNVSTLSITQTGIKAELDLPEDSYAVEMTFEEFLPVLKDWEFAWAAAQDYKNTLAKS
jgi:hypothetical protein